jgi:hypothetical protein
MQNCISDKWFKLVVKNNLVDQFKQTCTSMIENSSKGNNYKLFKHDLKFEDYLDVLDDKDKFLTNNINHLSEIQFCMFQIYDIPQSFKIQRILFNQAHVAFLF